MWPRCIYHTENVKAWMDFVKENSVSMNAPDNV